MYSDTSRNLLKCLEMRPIGSVIVIFSFSLVTKVFDMCYTDRGVNHKSYAVHNNLNQQ